MTTHTQAALDEAEALWYAVNMLGPKHGAATIADKLAAVRAESAGLVAALTALAIQYRSDLKYPPAADSIERRLGAISAVIDKTGANP